MKIDRIIKIIYKFTDDGDFNINMTDNRSSRKINDLCQEYGLSQLISDFTHITETSQSTIDPLLTNNSNDVLISGVGKPFFFRPKNLLSRPVFCILNRGARWLSGRVSDSGARGRGFDTYRRRVVSLSKTLYSPKVLVNYPGSAGSVPT